MRTIATEQAFPFHLYLITNSRTTSITQHHYNTAVTFFPPLLTFHIFDPSAAPPWPLRIIILYASPAVRHMIMAQHKSRRSRAQSQTAFDLYKFERPYKSAGSNVLS